MAREVKVTRTIETTEVTLLSLNLETAEPYTDTYEIPFLSDNPDKLKKYLTEHYNDETRTFAKIVDVRTVKRRHGMPLSKFIELSEELPLLPDKEDLYIPNEDIPG